MLFSHNSTNTSAIHIITGVTMAGNFRTDKYVAKNASETSVRGLAERLEKLNILVSHISYNESNNKSLDVIPYSLLLVINGTLIPLRWANSEVAI